LDKGLEQRQSFLCLAQLAESVRAFPDGLNRVGLAIERRLVIEAK
jgi:hypothetical protein